MRARGVSVVIAAIIMFTFLIIAVIPLMLSLLKSGTQEPIAISVLASSKVRESTPSLNITVDYDKSNDTTRVYLVENIAAEERKATLLIVQDDNNGIYFVRPGACIQTPCSAGLASVKVDLLRGAQGVNESIVLDPGAPIW
jgi:archaellum component FlaF (FlaF/FlaG flagellin family)